MSIFNLLSLFLLFSTFAVVVNRKYFKLPETIAVLLFSLGMSSFLLLLNSFVTVGVTSVPLQLVNSADMPNMLMHGILPILLFAGAMQTNLKHLLTRVVSVSALALGGTLISIFAFGTGLYFVLPLFHMQLSYTWCIVAGAILAPTDPVSVVSLLKKLGLPGPIQAVFAGESLFNDGMAVTVFGVALSMATTQSMHSFTIVDAFAIFNREAVGGAVIGFVTGAIAAYVLKEVKDSQIPLLITITLAICTYSLANYFDTSGAVAVVVSGLWLGTDTVNSSMDNKIIIPMKHFWEVIEGMCNSLLFLTMGAEVLMMLPTKEVWPIVLISIPISIIARFVGVSLITLPLPIMYDSKKRLWSVLTWGGIRGGVSVALALGLPEGNVKNIIAPVCYAVVVFTIIVQGLTMEKVVKYFYGDTIETSLKDLPH